MEFLAQAHKYKHNWWRYLLTIVLSVLLAQLCAGIIRIVIDLRFATPEMHAMGMVERTYALMENMGFALGFSLLVMLPFVFMLFFFFLFYKILHKGKIKDLLTAATKFRYGRFFYGVAVYGFILAAVLAIGIIFSDPGAVTFSFNANDFFLGLVLMLLLFPIQTLYEEVLCRSYLAQGLALITRQKWVVLIVPTLLFTGLHCMNVAVADSGTWALAEYFLMGLALALCTVLDDGLEMAWGVHFVNNLLATIIITFPNSDIRMPALFSSSEPSILSWESLLISFAVMALFLLIATKLYHWDWHKLFQKIERPQVSSLSRVDNPILYE